jgi:hypothetical protein
MEMGKKRKPQLTGEELATLIVEIAERVANEDYSFDIQVTISTAEQALLELRHLDGLKLLSRIALLMSTENGTTAMKYEYVRKRVEALTPLDPTADSVALSSLAAEIRTQT